MDDELQRHLHNENQRDAPLSNITDSYTPPQTLKATLKSSKTWKYIIYGCFSAQTIAISLIVIPIVGRKYFDESENNADDDNCDTNSYSRFAFWYSIFHCLSGFVAFLSQAYIGRLSDAFGRKKLLYFVWLCTISPFIPLCFTPNIWWYFALFPVAAFSGMTNAMPTILQCAMSDITAPHLRTTVYAMCIGLWASTMIITSIYTPIIIHHLGIIYAFYSVVGIKICQVFFLFFALPETLKKANRKPLALDHEISSDEAAEHPIELNKIGLDRSINANVQYNELDGSYKHNVCVKCKCCYWRHNPLKPLCFIRKNKVILWIAILSFLTAFPETGMNGLSMIYISDILGLCDEKENTKINSYLIISMSSFMVIANLIMLPILNTYMSDIKLMLFAVTILLITFFFAILIYFWPNIIAGLLLYAFNGISFVLIPILSGSLSKRVSAKQQGVALGVIHAVKGLNRCIAPFIFSYLYLVFSHSHPIHKAIPFMPFMFGTVIILMSYPIICCPLKNIFRKYDEYAFKASVVPFDDNPHGHIPPQQLL